MLMVQEKQEEEVNSLFVMATSSSDESSTAPKDFHLSSSLDSGSRSSPNRQKCPLCGNFRKAFFCKECIHSGGFYSSTSFPESYLDKQTKLLQIKAAKKQVEDDSWPLLERKQKADLMCLKIRQYKDRIRIFKLALEEKRQLQSVNKTKLSNLRSKNIKLAKSLPKYEDRVEKLETYIAKKEEDIAKKRKEILKKQEDLKRFTRLRIQQLFQFIFPITKIQPKSINISSDLESSESEMVSAIAEAAHTTYIRDKWIYTDNSGELQYSIVAPSLPGSGNYSAYSIWVAQNRDGVPIGGSSSMAVEHNPAYSISAALTYTAQLINIIAYYLDIRLPYKMVYSDFCSSDMNEEQFSRRVARLNANVLHLCFTQNVDLLTLQPTQTLHNILQLLDMETSDLGRHGPLEVDAEIALNLEEQLGKDLHTSEDSDSEGGDAFPYEWEAVPHVQCPEVSAGPINFPSVQTISGQQGQVNSIAGGLYTSAAASIASIWRGWTGR